MTERLGEPTAHPPPSVMSQDELRKKLYQTFKERGVLDTLKTQLRQQMIQELMQPVLHGEVRPQSAPAEGSTLLVEASNILVADHLQRCGYEYSLSVFYPESGLAREKMFTMEDLLQLVQISPQSSTYKTLISRFDKENQKGFLMQFLKELANYYQPKVICDVETQTNSLPNRDSLAEKFQLIDDQFAEVCIPRPKTESLEMKLHEYKREIEEQLRIEMCEKLKYLKDTEIAKVKMEERRKSEKELAEFRKEFEIACQVKSEALLSQERETVERIQKQREIETKAIFAERQILLKDMDLLREREEELKQKMNAFELAQKVKEEENKIMMESLRKREQDIKNIEETYEEKLKNEILKCQLELKDDYITRSSKLMEDEKKNKEKTIHLEEELSVLKSKLKELKYSENHAKELELELESAKVQVLALTEQNQKLNDKVKEKNLVMKEGNLALQAQNRLLQQQLEESSNENLRLRNRLPKKSSEIVVFQQDHRNPEGFNASLSLHNSFDSHRQVLHKQLQSEIEHSAQLKAQLLDYDSSVKRLTTQVSNLKLQLRQTQAALENEMYHNPKPPVAEDSSSAGEVLTGNILPLGPDTSSDLPIPPLDQDRLGEATVKTTRGDQDSLPDSDLEFVASTKARVKELEHEAEQLEKAFQEYNLRVSQQQPQSLEDERELITQQVMRNGCPFTPRSRRRCVLIDGRVGSEPPLAGLHDGERSSMSEVPTSSRSPRRRSIASRRLSPMSLTKAKKSLEDELYREGDGQSYVNTSEPCLDNMPLLAEAKCNSPSHSHRSTLEQNASLFQRPIEVEDNNEFPNLDNPDFMDKEEFESFEYGGNLPRPFDLDGFYPAGDMPHIDSTTIAIHPAGDMLYTDSAAAAIPFQYPNADQKLVREQLEEEQLWEQQMKERRMREERRHSERQEALEKERRELERLEQERKMIEQSLNLDIEKEIEPSENETKEDSACGASPLEKYMKIIQQDQQQEAEDKNVKKKAKEGSEVDTPPSSDKEASFTGFSQEDVDDFW